ncbi:hypothetical protein [Magnetospirillum sp. UT-4]|uniref:hypothetical protein n=1 Tax=Magnetospirillum sp. UT-4 TaxID=2681467 RepID=UPI001383D93F|nr:hypothetical protein [Magnetospirillum sp. UT-4]CAA7620094.1 conserved hypothetical protein [Magnetospirillum sp. UT-4]
MPRREVVVGQRFTPTGSSVQWEVRELVKDAEGIIHARLTRVGDPSHTKTLSVGALNDMRLFRPAPAPLPEAVAC